jgi:hypothetical protein
MRAGVVANAWRRAKAGDFAWRAQCLGKGTHPEVLQLLARIAHETAAVEAIWDDQAKAPDKTPWWADGEYDDREADRRGCADPDHEQLGPSTLKQYDTRATIVSGAGRMIWESKPDSVDSTAWHSSISRRPYGCARSVRPTMQTGARQLHRRRAATRASLSAAAAIRAT